MHEAGHAGLTSERSTSGSVDGTLKALGQLEGRHVMSIKVSAPN